MATIDCSGVTCTFVVQIEPYTATADDYTAMSTVFGVILAAACVIWGGKKLYNLLLNRPES